MPSIRVTVPHELSTDEAVARLKNAAGDLKAEHGDRADSLEDSWDGNHGEVRIKAYGVSVTVHIEVSPADVTMHSDLPLLAMAFTGRIEDEVQATLERILQK